MPRFKLRILTPASADIDNISAYHLLKVGPLSARQITDRLLDAILILENTPKAGTSHPDPVLNKQGYRKLICGDYICIYKLIDDTVYIYRVIHGATDFFSTPIERSFHEK